MLLLTGLTATNAVTDSDWSVPEETGLVRIPLETYEKLFKAAHLAKGDIEQQKISELRAVEKEEHKRANAKLTSDLIVAESDLQSCHDRIHRDHVRSAADLIELFDDGVQLLEHKYAGSFNVTSDEEEMDVASFNVTVSLRLLPRNGRESSWAVVPIANASAIVASGWSLEWRAEGGGSWTAIDFLSTPETLLYLRDGQYVLATNVSGQYRVGYTSYSRVRRSRHLKAIGFSTHFPLTAASFSLHGATGLAELAVQPPSAVAQHTTKWISNAENHSAPTTAIALTFPPTTYVEISWRDPVGVRPRAKQKAVPADAEEEEAASVSSDSVSQKPSKAAQERVKPEEESKPTATVRHDALISISEGLVQTVHKLVYKVTSDSPPLQTVEIVVHDKLTRVISVVASGMQSWSATQANGTTLITISFKSSHLEPTTNLMVTTELEIDIAKGSFTIPVLESVGALRQTGALGLATVANVQVESKRAFGLATAGADELASQLRLNTDRPLVLVFKYLSVRHSLQLVVHQHEQLATLEAVCHGAHYAATVIGSHTKHTLDVIMQHTRQQFIVVGGLPSSASMFSVVVDGVAATPVKGTSPSTLMLPLLGGSRQAGDNDGSSHQLRISLSYLSSSSPLEAAYWEGNATVGHWVPGNASFKLPWLELPISVLTAELSLPEAFEYNLSSAELGEDVEELSYTLPGNALTEGKGERARLAREAREITEKGHDFRKSDSTLNHRKRRKAEQQAPQDDMNVKVQLPSSGKVFYWQRLLVIDTPIAINVSYAPPPPPSPPPAPVPLPPSRSWWSSIWGGDSGDRGRK